MFSSIEMDKNFDLIIAGAGVIGLSLAWKASEKGLKVAVIDPHFLGWGATGAGTGIISHRGSTEFRSDYRKMCVESVREMYPAWIADLEAQSGILIGLNERKSYQLVFDSEIEAKMHRQLRDEKCVGWKQIQKRDLPEFLHKSSDLALAYWSLPTESTLVNSFYLNALHKVCLKNGVCFFWEHKIESIQKSEPLEVMLKYQNEQCLIYGQDFVIAAGAWCSELLELCGHRASLVPVKGQAATIELVHSGTEIIHIDEDFYLFPREGLTLVGATSEPNDWSVDFNQKGADYLELRLKNKLNLEYSPWTQTWAGIRGRSKDRKPFIGALEGEKHLWVSMAYYKNGVALAPAATDYLLDLILGHNPKWNGEELVPFRYKGVRPIDFDGQKHKEKHFKK